MSERNLGPIQNHDITPSVIDGLAKKLLAYAEESQIPLKPKSVHYHASLLNILEPLRDRGIIIESIECFLALAEMTRTEPNLEILLQDTPDYDATEAATIEAIHLGTYITATERTLAQDELLKRRSLSYARLRLQKLFQEYQEAIDPHIVAVINAVLRYNSPD